MNTVTILFHKEFKANSIFFVDSSRVLFLNNSVFKRSILKNSAFVTFRPFDFLLIQTSNGYLPFDILILLSVIAILILSFKIMHCISGFIKSTFFNVENSFAEIIWS